MIAVRGSSCSIFPFLEDDFPLAIDLRGREGRAKGHVGQKGEAGVQLVGGQDQKEHRVVEGCQGVRATARALHEPVDVPGTEPIRPFEQHMFLEVREAELIGLLVADAGADDQVDGHHVTGPVVLDDEPQSVGQHLAHGRRQPGLRPRRSDPGGRRAARRRRRAPRHREQTHPPHDEAPRRSDRHCALPVSSSTCPRRRMVALNGLPPERLFKRWRICARLVTFPTGMPSTLRMMSPPTTSS